MGLLVAAAASRMEDDPRLSWHVLDGWEGLERMALYTIEWQRFRVIVFAHHTVHETCNLPPLPC